MANTVAEPLIGFTKFDSIFMTINISISPNILNDTKLYFQVSKDQLHKMLKNDVNDPDIRTRYYLAPKTPVPILIIVDPSSSAIR